MKKKNIIIITGASSGMGKEFVRQCDLHFPNVDEFWLIARRKEKLNEIASLCKHKCKVLNFDLSESKSIEEIRDLLKDVQPQITMLINSAGYGILGPFAKENTTDNWLNEQTGMVRLNCEALTAMTYLCIPYMKEGGRIIQLASSAAFLPQPNFTVYAATKSYVLSFCRALNEELRNRRIYITAICPGPVDTEFFDRAEQGTNSLFIKKFFHAKPDKVVAKALQDTRNKKEISVYSIPMQIFFFASKLLPHKLMLVFMRILK